MTPPLVTHLASKSVVNFTNSDGTSAECVFTERNSKRVNTVQKQRRYDQRMKVKFVSCKEGFQFKEYFYKIQLGAIIKLVVPIL